MAETFREGLKWCRHHPAFNEEHWWWIAMRRVHRFFFSTFVFAPIYSVDKLCRWFCSKCTCTWLNPCHVTSHALNVVTSSPFRAIIILGRRKNLNLFTLQWISIAERREGEVELIKMMMMMMMFFTKVVASRLEAEEAVFRIGVVSSLLLMTSGVSLLSIDSQMNLISLMSVKNTSPPPTSSRVNFIHNKALKDNQDEGPLKLVVPRDGNEKINKITRRPNRGIQIGCVISENAESDNM